MYNDNTLSVASEYLEGISKQRQTLSGITDYNQLLDKHRATYAGSIEEAIIEERLLEISSVWLPGISDYNELIAIWNAVSDNSQLRFYVENRMTEINLRELPKINDVKEFMKRWQASLPAQLMSQLRISIEERLEEAVATDLDYSLARRLLEDIIHNKLLADVIRRGIARKIDGVDAKNIPEWCLDLMQKYNQPIPSIPVDALLRLAERAARE